MASGKAIIASVPKNGTAARLINKSGAGIVAAPENRTALAQPILNLHKNSTIINNIGYNSRQYPVNNYTVEQGLNSYESLFDEAIGQIEIRPGAVSNQEV